MKWLMLVLNFIFQKFSTRPPSLTETAVEIFEEISHKSRKVVSLTLTGVAAVIFFCGGLFIAIINATTQYDNTGEILFTATFLGGLLLIALAALTFGIIFLRAWPGAAKARQTRQKASQAEISAISLDKALAILIMDFVKERELRRSSTHHQPSETPQEPAPKEQPSVHPEPSIH
ncbi:MAG: hypothetical protein ACXVCY_13940 [Pseudobdellovibrionaceae bacterium]